VFNNEILFAGGDHFLWVTDGTAQGNHELNGIEYCGASTSLTPQFPGKVDLRKLPEDEESDSQK
jgi:hypothetical protein